MERQGQGLPTSKGLPSLQFQLQVSTLLWVCLLVGLTSGNLLPHYIISVSFNSGTESLRISQYTLFCRVLWASPLPLTTWVAFDHRMKEMLAQSYGGGMGELSLSYPPCYPVPSPWLSLPQCFPSRAPSVPSRALAGISSYTVSLQ